MVDCDRALLGRLDPVVRLNDAGVGDDFEVCIFARDTCQGRVDFGRRAVRGAGHGISVDRACRIRGRRETGDDGCRGDTQCELRFRVH